MKRGRNQFRERSVPLDAGPQLRKWRHDNGWTQARVAAEVGVEPNVVSSWECSVRLPNVHSWGRLQQMMQQAEGDETGMTEIVYWVLVKRQGKWQRAHNFNNELVEFTDLDACLKMVKNHLLLEQPPEISIRKVRHTTPDAE